MGLEEKRMKHALTTRVIPEITSEIGACYAGAVFIEIDWDTFTDVISLREIENQVLGRITSAVRTLCYDDFSKSVLKDSFKSIYVRNIENKTDRAVDFSEGKLSIQANWVDFGSIFTDADIKQAIEAGL